MKIFTIIAIGFLSIVTIFHILRIITGASITVNSWPVPIWLNGIGALVTCSLAVMLYRKKKVV
jgi:hypothetical protein